MGYAINLGDVTLGGTGYLPLAAFDIPVRDDLEAAFYLGHGAAVGVMNFAGEKAGAIVGSPVWADGYAEFVTANYLQTDVDEETAMTLIAVAKRKVTGNGTAIIGNYLSSTDVGIALYVASGNSKIIANADRAGGGGTVTANGDMDTWELVSLVVPATGAMTINNHTAATTANSAATDDRAVTGSGKLRLGSFPAASGFPGTIQVCAAAIFSRPLTSPELSEMAENLRGYASSVGITV